MEEISMKIAVGGSAANPSHIGHQKLVEAIMSTEEFDQVRWIVSGDRPDKPNMPLSRLRWEMGKLLFNQNKKPLILYEPDQAIPTIEVLENLQECYKNSQIVWYCGADHFVPRKRFNGDCDILGFWDDGKILFEKQEFLIIPRKGLDMNILQLPKHYKILNVSIPEISSTDIRSRVVDGKSIDQLVSKEVATYIQQKKLYR